MENKNEIISNEMQSDEIRSRFLKFFEKRGHKIIPSASLVPENDPSVLFNTAGMQPLVPYLLGQKHPMGTRLADSQKCVRTNDIDEVGDNTHLTFFEMLGNWSLGDYWKEESINWSFELLTSQTEGFGLNPQRLYVTCFEGDENAPQDTESAKIWQEIFKKNNVTGERIYFRPKEKNWWAAGDNGPCGPDTEMFYDLTGKLDKGMTLDEYLLADDEQRIVEIWNNVFMEYLSENGKVVGKLPTKNVDTGSGLERVVAVIQGRTNVFETDFFENTIRTIFPNGLPPKDSWVYEKNLKAARIIADHSRTATFLIADGVLPSNTYRGYILRRLIRRAIFQCHENNIQLMPHHLVDIVAEKYKDTYPNIIDQKEFIIKVITEEELKFLKTLKDGLKELQKMAMGLFNIYDSSGTPIETTLNLSGKNLFFIYSTYGFPFELSIEEINKIKLHLKDGYKYESLSNVDVEKLKKEFDEEMKKHQKLSQTASAGMFKGGLANHNEKTIKLHTAHHLLLAGLQTIVNKNIKQRGSNITEERLRMDFSCDHKLTEEEKQKVEAWVNDKIQRGLNVVRREMPLIEAEKLGAEMEFGAKYPEIVSVYFIEDENGVPISKEFCGGPHVANTSELGIFKIQKEEAVAQGIRRIKAILLPRP